MIAKINNNNIIFIKLNIFSNLLCIVKMFGKVENNNNSYYTSKQIALLMAVDPDIKNKYEKNNI